MNKPFEREHRYIVFKLSDLGEGDQWILAATAAKIDENRVAAGKQPLECVVVEADWPEYEAVWKMIEDRMAGKDSYHIKNHSVAVASDYYWQPIETCPIGVKVQLLGAGGVATYGQYHGAKFWRGWCPVPQKPENLKC